MKKALQITIAGTLFTIEEDAYQKLDGYLKSIHDYFGKYPDSKEIINDIEARIAEQLLANDPEKNKVVSIQDVERLITIMGRVEDFEGTATVSSSDSTESSAKNYSGRKLYRNTDDVWVMGVASGIAAYFNVDPLIIRIAFIILIFISSIVPGIVLYFILALVIPPAKTPAEKVNMRGGPVNLSSFKESIKNTSTEFKDNIKKNSSEFFQEGSSPRNAIKNVSSGIGAIIHGIVKVIFSIIGFFIKLVTVLAIIFVTYIFVVLALRFNTPFIQFPLADVVSTPVYYLFIVLGYLAVIFPLIIVSMIASVIMRRKRSSTLYGMIGIIGTWFVVILVLITLAAKYGPEIQDKVNALPQYQVVSKTEDIKDFSKIELHGTTAVHITQGKEFSVTSQGRQIDLDLVTYTVENGTLVIDQRSEKNHICIFCWDNERVMVSIVMPNVEAIAATDITKVTSDRIISKNSLIVSSDASSINLNLVASTTTFTTTDISRVKVTGSADSLKLTTKDVSRFDGASFLVKDANVESSDISHATVNASSTLSVTINDLAKVKNEGVAKIDTQ